MTVFSISVGDLGLLVIEYPTHFGLTAINIYYIM